MRIENIKEYIDKNAIYGMRYSFESQNNSDTFKDNDIGVNDLELIKKLVKSGKSHRKVLRTFIISFDLTASQYFWSQFDTYKIGTVSLSTSKMHTLLNKHLSLKDFEIDIDDKDYIKFLTIIIREINYYIDEYKNTKDKKYWLNALRLLPISFLQKRYVMLNYEVLLNIYQDRKNHKLNEWRYFLDILIKNLQYFKFFIN